MALYTPYSSKGTGLTSTPRTTEFDILKSSHKFLREDDERDERQLSWDERLAKKYYSSLYREYAVCDLKHYKSGNFALRWRTEEEVLSGAGETTCGNTRCPLHKEFPDATDNVRPALTTLELPFAYTEHGESKFALVKVVLCSKCCKKLMWKRNKDKEELTPREERHARSEERPGHGESSAGPSERQNRERSPLGSRENLGHREGRRDRKGRSPDEDSRGHEHRRIRSSRSRSPRRLNNSRYEHSS